jgi:hypothetical protein
VVEGELCGVGFGAEVVEHALKGDAGAWCTGSVARGKRAGGSDGLAERGSGLRGCASVPHRGRTRPLVCSERQGDSTGAGLFAKCSM